MINENTYLTLLLSHLNIGSAYVWQLDAFSRLCNGEPPSQIKVPTAAGKTMILPIFIAALAAQAVRGHVTLPRRLVHVVNRRVLVDDASSLGEKIVQAINQVEELKPLHDALSGLSASGQAIVVSTLRGGISDNGAWSVDPSTPAIILATPDMLGSRLLFRGYGVGRSRSATHAGLLGCDTLVVHDEAHLAPAFSALLRKIELLAEPGSLRIGRPPMRVIEMTATLNLAVHGKPLVCDIAADPALTARMSAPKRLQIINIPIAQVKSLKPNKAIEEALATMALAERDANRAVAIFVSSPTSAGAIAKLLQKKGVDPQRIITLTGTMRGQERADLANTPAFKRFAPDSSRTLDGTAYFIATSAGEIGLDIDADVGLFDATTLDRFIQRCGRINRRGQEIGLIKLAYAAGEEFPAALMERGQKALDILNALPVVDGTADVSPLALSRLCDRSDYAEAIEPAPAVRSLEPAIVDLLSLTSLRLDELCSPSPDVFIHGLVEDRAEINLAWRHLPAVTADFADWLDAIPVSPMETAKLPIEAARKLLSDRLFAALDTRSGVLAVALDAQGIPVFGEALFVPSMRVGRWIARLRPGSIVLLSTEVGGLNIQGIPDPTSNDAVPDVLTSTTGASGSNDTPVVEMRQLDVSYHYSDEGVEWRHEDQLVLSLENLLQKCAGNSEIVFHDGPKNVSAGDWSGTISVWLSKRAVRSPDDGDLASLSKCDRLLDEHLDLTARAARRLSACLGLSAELAGAEIRASAEHDRGKAWERWQRAIGNHDASRILGKSAGTSFAFKINDGYRHELGSLVDRGATLTLLERHLVASHHGWCRPGFREAALLKPGCSDVALNAANGFAELHQTLGPWALCYLEGVLKSADVLAEILDVPLATNLAQPLPNAVAFPLIVSRSSEEFRLPLDARNFGEYLAGLGLASLAILHGADILIGWADGHLVISGISSSAVLGLLRNVRSAEVKADQQSTIDGQENDAYPPLQLLLCNGTKIILNHWLDENLRSSSYWKLGAGRTTALKTLASVVAACSDSLDLPDFDAVRIFSIGGDLVGADSSKFRFDSATNWTARDAGFSLNENDAFKSTRPWVELLSVLGLQHFFLPPADAKPAYFTWHGLLTPTLALAAVKGLLPQCDNGYEPVFRPSGKMKDVFSSQSLFSKRKSKCQTHIRVI